MKTSQKGFSALDIILVIVALAAIGAAVYFAVWGHKTASTTSTSKTAAIIKTSPTPSPTVSANTLQIPELGVQITLPSALSKVTYAAIPASQYSAGGYYGLTDAKLLNQDSSCTAALAPIGSLTIATSAPSGGSAGQRSSQLLSNGKYLVIALPSGVVCDNVQLDGGVELTDGQLMLNAIKTATVIK